MDLRQLVSQQQQQQQQHHQQQSAVRPPSREEQQDLLPDLGSVLFDALGHTLSVLRAGPSGGGAGRGAAAGAAAGDWTAKEVEVEVRLGMIVTGSRRLTARCEKNKAVLLQGKEAREDMRAQFRAGVDETFVRQLHQRLSETSFSCEVQQQETVYCSSVGSKRYSLLREDDENDFKVFKEEEKERILDLQVALLAFDYDLRITGAKERAREGEIVVPNGTSKTTNGESFLCDRIRIKKRSTYYPRRSARLWRIDLTEVISSTISGGNKEIEYELEFEMDQNVKMEWIGEQNSQLVIEKTRELTTSLLFLISSLVPSIANHSGARFEKNDVPSGTEMYKTIRRNIIEINQSLKPSGTKLDFLGSMPINLYRKSLKNVQNAPYFLAEKTDGVRYLMYTLDVDNTGLMTVLLNRDGAISRFRGGDVIASKLGSGAILDGEIVFNLSLKRFVFLVFDVLMIDGEAIASEIFPNRLSAIENILSDDVISDMDENLEDGGALLMRRKRYFAKGDISELIERFQEDKTDGERYFIDDSGKKSHRTDGIIFQPSLPYDFGRCYDLYKWKWSDMRSVDLGVSIIFGTQKIEDSDVKNDEKIHINGEVSNHNIHLWCAKGQNERIDCTKRGESNVGLGKFDSLRLLAEYDERRINVDKSRPVIAEVCYDTCIGMWSFLKVRDDKSAPNAIDAVMGVFTEQAEAICIEELEFSLLGNMLNDDNSYLDLLNKCKSEIIRLQRIKKRQREDQESNDVDK